MTWEGVLGTSHLSFSLVPVLSRFFVTTTTKYFLQIFGVAQSCCDRRRAASCQLAAKHEQCWAGMARGWSCPKCV